MIKLFIHRSGGIYIYIYVCVCVCVCVCVVCMYTVIIEATVLLTKLYFYYQSTETCFEWNNGACSRIKTLAG